MTDIADRQLSITRIFDAPRERVFEAWVNPEQIVKWWGPIGFTTTTHSSDVKPGGQWRFTMHGPDGTDYPNLVTFTEIDPPAKIAYDHGGSDELEVFKVVVLFKDLGEKTEVYKCSTFVTVEEYKRVVEVFGADKGLSETMDRLGKFVNIN